MSSVRQRYTGQLMREEPLSISFRHNKVGGKLGRVSESAALVAAGTWIDSRL
jgi:hypothetical protein